MDKQDLQDGFRFDLPFGEIAEEIIGCAFEVSEGVGIKVGLRINVGHPKLETKRFT